MPSRQNPQACRRGLRRSARGLTPSVTKTSTQSSRFLTIPGGAQDLILYPRLLLTIGTEIRNAIYDRCLEAPRRRLTPRGSRLRPHSARGCLALTQVCKQLRVEMRPLYIEKGISVRLSQVTPLIESFFSSTLDPQMPTRLCVDIHRSAKMRPINIKPILQACIAQDAMQFSFYSEDLGRRLAPKLTKSLHRQPKAWQEMIREYADRVYLQPAEERLAIVFRRGRFRDWITNKSIRAEKFWTDLGFRTRSRGSVRLEVSNIDYFFNGDSSSRDWFLCGLQAPFLVTQTESLWRHRYEEPETGSCCPCSSRT
jgi:hypothetical protein